jgi:hypothetical protein
MFDLGSDARAALDELSPPCLETGDWHGVLGDARPRLRRVRFGALALAAVAVAATVALWPGSGPQGGVLGRALAATGDGPVVHVVLEGEWGGTLLDLRTGAKRELRGRKEFWYDPRRNLVREVLSLGGQISDDSTYRPARTPADIVGPAAEYRAALENGTARVAGRAEIDGIPVYWIVVHSEQLPDVGDGQEHLWTQQVAISASTYEAIATRETKDGEIGPDTGQRVLRLENVPLADAHFSNLSPQRLERPQIVSGGWTATDLDAAARLLGKPVVGLGQSFRGLPLAGVGTSIYEVRPAHGPTDHVDGIQLHYGKLDDARRPDYSATPFVSIREVARMNDAFRFGGYLPPPGQAFLLPDSVFLRVGELYVFVNASSDELALAAARVLEPVNG